MNRPAQSFDSDAGKKAVGLLIAIALGLGAWNLQGTIDNASAIQDERAARLGEAADIRERLARIEANTELLLERSTER